MTADLRDRLRTALRWTGSGDHYLVSDRSGWWRDPLIPAGLGDAPADPFRRPVAEPMTWADDLGR